MNLYLVTLTGNDHVLIVSSDRELASDYCLPVMSFGQWVEKVEFISVVSGDYQEGEILKHLKSSDYE